MNNKIRLKKGQIDPKNPHATSVAGPAKLTTADASTIEIKSLVKSKSEDKLTIARDNFIAASISNRPQLRKEFISAVLDLEIESNKLYVDSEGKSFITDAERKDVVNLTEQLIEQESISQGFDELNGRKSNRINLIGAPNEASIAKIEEYAKTVLMSNLYEGRLSSNLKKMSFVKRTLVHSALKLLRGRINLGA